MKKTNLSSETFKRVLDEAPSEVTLWKSGKVPKNWKDYVTLYCNKETVRVTGPALIENLGSPAGKLFSGLEKTDLIKTLIHSIETRQIQECVYFFGNEHFKKKYRQYYFVPLSQKYFGGVVINVDLQMKAEKEKKEKIKQLEAINQQMVERELEMIQIKNEISNLEKKVKEQS